MAAIRKKPTQKWVREHQTDFYATVGYLCHQWNWLERIYGYLGSDILRLNRDKHDVLFRHFGFVALQTLMREYAEQYLRSKASIEQIRHVTQYVDNCRINRNAIVHGFPDDNFDPSKPLELLSYPDQRRSKVRTFSLSLNDVGRVCEEIQAASTMSMRLQFLFMRNGVGMGKRLFGHDWRAKLYAKPALPKLLVVNPPKPPKPRRQRRSSQG
jgi:hypothetical protein